MMPSKWMHLELSTQLHDDSLHIIEYALTKECHGLTSQLTLHQNY